MPWFTQTELVTLYNIKQNTVFNILRNKDKWLLVNSDLEEANKQREKNVHFSQVEEALSLWITNALSANLIISDILREKAEFFVRRFEINNFSASNEWISNFKKWNNIREYTKWDEATSILLENLDEKRQNCVKLLRIMI